MAGLFSHPYASQARAFGAVTFPAEAPPMRMACIYALVGLSHTVRPYHLRAGLAVWQYCEASARFIFGDSLGDVTADEILQALRASSQGLSRTAIRDHFQRNKSGAEINRALGVLQELGLARMEKS